jgi:hypothetical protein
MSQGGFPYTGNVLEEYVTPSQKGRQGQANDFTFSVEDPLDLIHEIFQKGQLWARSGEGR